MVAGVVVCGGLSRRMGTDKALLEVGGVTLLERVVAELRPAVGELVLACGSRERYAELGLPLALDAETGSGPLAGIVAGFEAVDAERILVVACDMPRIVTELFEILVSRACEEDLDICFLEGERGIEPLCAVYRRSCLAPMRSALEEGRRRVRGFLEDGEGFSVGRVRTSELSDVLRGLDLAANWNTPADRAAGEGGK
jgi:molybdenum cofactor guanylyltransferase